jgi:phosphatidylethanolamine-binding protein (PEBP) family uncharacterized protein
MDVLYNKIRVSGQALTKSETQVQPKVHFKGEQGSMYTLIMSDPDAPAKDWLHWLVINNNGKTKETIQSYEGPNPPSGTHHYIFYLCEQPTKLTIDKPKTRASFDTASFIKNNKLRIVQTIQYTVTT